MERNMVILIGCRDHAEPDAGEMADEFIAYAREKCLRETDALFPGLTGTDERALARRQNRSRSTEPTRIRPLSRPARGAGGS